VIHATASSREPERQAPAIQAQGLVKRYGSQEAVRGVSFEVAQGEAFGILGPNGAGKSSTMRIIGCVSKPTAGRLSVLGMSAEKFGPRIRGSLGVVPQEDALDEELTVLDNIKVYGRYFGLPHSVIRERAVELLAFANLTERADERIRALSGGMKRRLTIARSLINDPRIVLLDEPTTALDPQARHILWERLSELKQQGTTLVLTTHFMDEAEQLCDRLIVMDEGVIIAAGTPLELIDRYCSKEVVEIELQDLPDSIDTLLHPSLSDRLEELSDRTLVHTVDGDAVVRELATAGVAIHSAYVRRAGLEDVYLRLTGRRLVE
jgi:lipooligosaccharide transport system ATP-binding protein